MAEDVFVMCYDTIIARDTYYLKLLAYARRARPPARVRLVNGTLLTGVPYPYCVWVFCDERDAEKVDLWLSEGPPPEAPDFYAGVARAREFEEYRKRGLVKIEAVEFFGPWLRPAKITQQRECPKCGSSLIHVWSTVWRCPSCRWVGTLQKV